MNESHAAIATALKGDLLTAQQISQNIDMNYKTCFGNLSKMREAGYVEQLDDKTYSLTDFGRIEFKVAENQKKEIENPAKKSFIQVAQEAGFIQTEEEMKEKIEPVAVKIVNHDAPINYTPINEKTVNEIKHHVNGTTPDYYKGKTMQVFDVLNEFLSAEANQGFYVGNIIKYVLRFRGKNGKEDLLKARNYLDKLIDSL